MKSDFYGCFNDFYESEENFKFLIRADENCEII